MRLTRSAQKKGGFRSFDGKYRRLQDPAGHLGSQSENFPVSGKRACLGIGCLPAVVAEVPHNHVPSLEVLLEIETEAVFRSRGRQWAGGSRTCGNGCGKNQMTSRCYSD